MLAALDDITVLDLGQIYNGPYATFLLASSGARVIKVESLQGEVLRGRGQNSPSSYAFSMLNQNKESIAVNLKEEAGKTIFRKLVAKADVVLENFSPDAMAKLGFSPEELLAINPRLIYAAGSGYGREGGQREFLAMDITVQAMSGIMSATGFPESPPLKAGVALCDFFGGIHLYGAIVTALYRRQKTGQGAVIDVAMQDSVLPTLATVMGAYYYGGQQVPDRTGNHHPAMTMAPYNVYQTVDGHIAIICVRDGHWRSLLQVMGRDDLLADNRLEKMLDRADQMEAIDSLVGDWLAPLPKQEAVSMLQAEGVPSAVVRNVEEVLNDEHLHERGTLHWIDHPAFGKIAVPTSPLFFQGEERQIPSPPPDLGEHTDSVLSELAELTDQAIEELRSQNIVR